MPGSEASFEDRDVSAWIVGDDKGGKILDVRVHAVSFQNAVQPRALIEALGMVKRLPLIDAASGPGLTPKELLSDQSFGVTEPFGDLLKVCAAGLPADARGQSVADDSSNHRLPSLVMDLSPQAATLPAVVVLLEFKIWRLARGAPLPSGLAVGDDAQLPVEQPSHMDEARVSLAQMLLAAAVVHAPILPSSQPASASRGDVTKRYRCIVTSEKKEAIDFFAFSYSANDMSAAHNHGDDEDYRTFAAIWERSRRMVRATPGLPQTRTSL